MFRKMENNGSPLPIIETDEESTYFMVTLPINPEFLKYEANKDGVQVNNMIFNSLDDLIAFSNEVSNGVSNGVSNAAKDIIINEIHDKVAEILKVLIVPQKRGNLFKIIALSNQTKNRVKYIDRLIDLGWIAKEFPDELNNPTQRYFTTESGKKVLTLIS